MEEFYRYKIQFSRANHIKSHHWRNWVQWMKSELFKWMIHLHYSLFYKLCSGEYSHTTLPNDVCHDRLQTGTLQSFVTFWPNFNFRFTVIHSIIYFLISGYVSIIKWVRHGAVPQISKTAPIVYAQNSGLSGLWLRPCYYISKAWSSIHMLLNWFIMALSECVSCSFLNVQE